jgi:DNA-binding transcriptional MerR regulator
MLVKMRVEELSMRAGVSVDTIRFYQKQRLLPAPLREGRVAWYTDEHLSRLERVKELQRRGLTLALIRRLTSGALDPADEPLAAAVAAAGDSPEGELLTLEQLATRAGMPAAIVDSIAREGLLVPRIPAGPGTDGEALYTAEDVRVVAAGLRLLQAGLPLAGLLELARMHHRSTRKVAAAAVELFDKSVRRPLRDSDMAEEDKAQALVDSFSVVLPAVSELVAHHFRRVLLLVAQEHLEAVGHPAEVAAAAAVPVS